MATNFWKYLVCAAALFAFVVPNSIAGSCDNILNEDIIKKCLADDLSAADKELNRVYIRLRESIGNTEGELLKQTEITWINLRNSDCEFEAQSVSGGTAYQLVYLSCLISQTKIRTKQLSDWTKLFKKR